MKVLLKILSAIGLALTVLPGFIVWSGAMEWQTHAHLMFVGMVLWFVTAPFWMNRERG